MEDNQPNNSPPEEEISNEGINTLEKLLNALNSEEERQLVSSFVEPLLEQATLQEEKIRNADTEGYLRGRNEKIELVTHPAHEEADEVPTPTPFPRYNRRSVWDL